ncbi:MULTISPECIES: zf-HC2 domain-containing protein [unclassified Streptomyces]|uniref:anti-sigma factor family protein n=1 Tax=unclassified Streptomyces TaxID=2593676 RepID=UPI00340D26F9
MSTEEQHDGGTLTAYVLGALDAEEVRAVEEHIATCGRCRAEVDELREMERALGEVPPEIFLDGPPEDGALLLQRTLREVRSERTGVQRRRWTAAGAAAAAAAAVLILGGVVIGQNAGTADVAGPPGASAQPGAKVASATDPATKARMTVRVTPASAWVRLNASVSGIPAGERCRLVVVGKDGHREVAGSWVVPKAGEEHGVSLDGSAAVAADDISEVVVENAAGKEYVTARV